MDVGAGAQPRIEGLNIVVSDQLRISWLLETLITLTSWFFFFYLRQEYYIFIRGCFVTFWLISQGSWWKKIWEYNPTRIQIKIPYALPYFFDEPCYSYNRFKPRLEDDTWFPDSAIVVQHCFIYTFRSLNFVPLSTRSYLPRKYSMWPTKWLINTVRKGLGKMWNNIKMPKYTGEGFKYVRNIRYWIRLDWI